MLKSFSNVPLSHLLAIKFVELVLYFMINYIYDIFLLVFISRVPWLYISFLVHPFPLWIILFLLLFDIYSLFGPFYLVSNERYALFRDKELLRSSLRPKHDGVLSILLSALISSICSIIVYVVSKLSLIPLSSAYFSIKHFVAPIPLPILMVAFFPLGFCIQKIILSLGPFKAYLYMILTMAWVTSSYLYLLIRDITFHAIWVSVLTFCKQRSFLGKKKGFLLLFSTKNILFTILSDVYIGKTYRNNRPNLRWLGKKRKFVADGVFFAELNELFTRELSAEGYSGTEVRVTPSRTEIIIRATHTQEVLGEKGRRIRELTSLIQKRFKFPDVAQCESLRYKLLAGLAVRRAAYGVLRFIMESGAKGCEVVISGKLRAARAKSMKFTDGFMIHSGQPARDFIDSATRHVLLRQGVLGVKVKIMLNEMITRKPLPDSVVVIEPKPEEHISQPSSEDFSRQLSSDLTQQPIYRVHPPH
ncbi:hypothetical protein MERGE_002717 [Pneumocystis wakefieldiae]|uniref:40S ribosomal protein S3 n=1 Tax=Pneumocystis wakefieldiae TaxID=38082 RepID=A0A899GA01_9ASCO|nr:hypothetical protein MERGE_002717 [Pneumocystis wakefieldiae]